MTDWPPKFEVLRAFLEQQGFVCTRDESPLESMGYRLIEYTRGIIGVQLERDRSYWELRIGEPFTRTWYPLAVFSYILPGAKRPHMTIAEQIAFSMARWSEILIALRDEPTPRLEAANNER